MNLKDLLLVIIITFTIAFAFQGSCGLFETTEGRYAEASREMLETNDWLTPRLDYKPHWTKPPMIYWCIAACMKVFGVNTWGARICNSFFFCIIILLVLYLSYTLWGAAAAYFSGLIGATAPFLIIGLNSLSTDMLLALWELLTVVSYWKSMKTQEMGNRKKWFLVLWLSAGLSFLTKGPPALLTLLCIILFNYIQKFRKRPHVNFFWLPAIGVFIVSGFTWYVLVILKNPGLLNYYLTDEVAGRVLTAKHHRNSSWYAPLYIYLLPILLGLGPWVFFWIKSLNAHANRWIEIFRKRQWLSDETVFFAIWLIVPLIILSLAKSRLILYLLPFFPSLIFLTSRLISSIQSTSIQKVCRNISICTAVVIIILKGSLSLIPSSKNMLQLYNSIKKESPFSITNCSVISLHENHLYGLQFYFKGHFKRVDKKNVENEINADLNRSTKHPDNSGLIILYNNSNALPKTLQLANIPLKNQKVLNKFKLYFVNYSN